MTGSRGSGKTPDPASYLGVGLTWTLSTLLFLWLGSKADGWLGTEPWLTLVGAFVGAAAGFYYMIHHLIVVPGRRSGEPRGPKRTEEGSERR